MVNGWAVSVMIDYEQLLRRYMAAVIVGDHVVASPGYIRRQVGEQSFDQEEWVEIERLYEEIEKIG